VYSIIICGGGANNLTANLKRAVSEASVITDTCHIIKPHSDILIYAADMLPKQTEGSGLCVLTQGAVIDKDTKINGNFYAVVNSEYGDMIEALSALPIKTITCGLKSSDTITISSNSDNTALLSLQRSIINRSGKMIEPFEMPAEKIKRLTLSELLLFYTILLCLDKLKCERI
jgi:hypothetical protein